MKGELRIPSRLLSSALSQKKVKQLRLLASAKLEGHRVEITALLEGLNIHPKTGNRLVKRLVADGWAGTDDEFLFPRAWRKLKFNKRGGLYITTAPKDLKKFEALCFAKALKKILSRKASPQRPEIGRTKQNADLPTTYLTKALGLKERRFKSLKSNAQRYRYISVKSQFKIIGKVNEYAAISKNLHGIPVFKRGKYTVTPDISKIKVLI
jgi:hypothetical protein